MRVNQATDLGDIPTKVLGGVEGVGDDGLANRNPPASPCLTPNSFCSASVSSMAAARDNIGRANRTKSTKALTTNSKMRIENAPSRKGNTERWSPVLKRDCNLEKRGKPKLTQSYVSAAYK